MHRIMASRSPSVNDFDVSALLEMRSKSPSPPTLTDFYNQPALDVRGRSEEPPLCSEGYTPSCGWKATTPATVKKEVLSSAAAQEEEACADQLCGCGPGPSAAPFENCGGVGPGIESEQATARAGPNANGKKRRGMHVVDKPEMPQTARDGQHDWQQQRQPLEDEWESKGVGANELFKSQIEKCKLACKNQKLCLLFVLQLFVVDGVITPNLNEALVDSTEDSFFGWTGFSVNPQHSSWFRSKIESLWPGQNPPRETTLNNAFRRCGFIPTTSWDAAIRGHDSAAFTYKKCKEYKKQRTGAGGAASSSGASL